MASINAQPQQPNVMKTNFKYPDYLEQTILLAKSGNKLAFSNIIKEYQQPIYNFCYRKLRDKDEADDATQEIFIRAYVKLDTYDDEHKFSTWLFSIASHYCIDILRRRRFQVILWDDLYLWNCFPNQDTPQPEQTLLAAETLQEIQALLSTLPPDYCTVVNLKYWQAQSYQEIAQTLNTTVSAVKSRLFRARKMIAVKLTSHVTQLRLQQ